MIKKFPANGSNQTLDERVGHRSIRDALNFFDVKDVQIRLPPMIFEKGIMIRTQVAGRFDPGDDSVEHSAKHPTIDSARVNAKSDNTAGELFHHHQHPMTL